MIILCLLVPAVSNAQEPVGSPAEGEQPAAPSQMPEAPLAVAQPAVDPTPAAPSVVVEPQITSTETPIPSQDVVSPSFHERTTVIVYDAPCESSTRRFELTNSLTEPAQTKGYEGSSVIVTWIRDDAQKGEGVLLRGAFRTNSMKLGRDSNTIKTSEGMSSLALGSEGGFAIAGGKDFDLMVGPNILLRLQHMHHEDDYADVTAGGRLRLQLLDALLLVAAADRTLIRTVEKNRSIDCEALLISILG